MHKTGPFKYAGCLNLLKKLRRLNPGPGVRGLDVDWSMQCHACPFFSLYGLADIDVVGLRPVASLLD